MIKQLSIKVVSLSLLLVLSMVSCKKETSVLDTSFAINESVAQAAGISVEGVADMITVRDNEGHCNTNFLDRLPDCAIVTGNTDVYPKTITVDFGNGCVAKHNRILKGEIIINITDDLMVENAVRTVTFENFFVNETQIEGIRVKTNTGLNNDGQQTFSTSVSTTLTRLDKVITRAHEGTQTWLSGYDTDVCDDNVFQLEGSGSVTRADGTVVTRTITTPLVVDRNCGYVISGVIEMNAPDRMRTIDFGQGTCDDEATVSNGTDTWTIDLDKHRRRG